MSRLELESRVRESYDGDPRVTVTMAFEDTEVARPPVIFDRAQAALVAVQIARLKPDDAGIQAGMGLMRCGRNSEQYELALSMLASVMMETFEETVFETLGDFYDVTMDRLAEKLNDLIDARGGETPDAR